ncbi:hypothetical protein HPB49_006534 [Dermacentor silvarum]|uniref:Uncharacterized protein n=1 Tax=Dermacentor silvarum TaxID=543639 RepID=A0ACB8D3I4_DERSI|nr:hypothetical protein HPB49_006534 [Dermacentor silvarum]
MLPYVILSHQLYVQESLLVYDVLRLAAILLLYELLSNKQHIFQVSLGRHRVTPDAVSAVLKSMCDSGHYHLTDNNCQEWVLELLRRLDIQIPDDSPPAARRVVRETAGPLALFGASLLSGALLIVGLVGSNAAARRAQL